MNKQHYTLYLRPRRADFAQTMTAEEQEVMQRHIAYWMEFMNKGNVVTFGPVFDPAEAYGLGVVCFEEESQLMEFMQNDPAAAINRYEHFPMRAIVRNETSAA